MYNVHISKKSNKITRLFEKLIIYHRPGQGYSLESNVDKTSTYIELYVVHMPTSIQRIYYKADK